MHIGDLLQFSGWAIDFLQNPIFLSAMVAQKSCPVFNYFENKLTFFAVESNLEIE